MITASEVRQSYLDFFAKHDHRIVASAPVVPADDPTLLFTNAGMNQFKDVFLGTGSRPYRRAADAQKCIRVSGKHNDLEEVGHDTYHHTFFEMMGNWSFGDYYKEEAIRWAWELVTGVWGLPKKKIWATVFREDDEAEALWKRVTDIRPSQVLRFDEKDNFWEMGETGPCGPCSEIHIDLGEGYCDKQDVPGHTCAVNAGCARVIELWNLVFIQFNRDESGTCTPLPSKHVDTGLGLERTVAVLQGKRSNYQTDLFAPLFERISEITGRPHTGEENLPAFRVISDHVRALTFAVTDGAIPSNEGRGYVLRRILRRAARYGRKLGMHEPFIHRLVETVSNSMAEAYPEVGQRIEHTTHVIKAEEERFNEVLDRGIDMFESVVAGIVSRGQKIISGEDAFRLYDTYGFPLDLTRLMAGERGLGIDEAGFEAELETQRMRAREAGKFAMADEGDWEEMTTGPDSEFIGYEYTEAEANIRRYRRADDRVTIVLDRTPFYGESGGQVGDKGEIVGEGFRLRIDDAQRQGDQVLHLGVFVEGSGIDDAKVTVSVHSDRRISTARNHTATHLLHKALKEVLGEHVNQSGSLVLPDRLRFDFTHFEAMTRDLIDEVERRVNEQVRADHAVETYFTSIDEAKADGATALFGEKYDDDVRVVKISDFSMELCGGTHLERTGQIGYFRIVKEEGVAAGVRRIEALTGEGADKHLRDEKHLLEKLGAALLCREDEIEARVSSLIEERKDLDRRLRNAERMSAAFEVEAVLKKALDVSGIRVVASPVETMGMAEFRKLGDRIRDKLKSGVGVIGMVAEQKAHFLCVVTDDLVQAGKLKAGEIVKDVARLAGGSGGGKPHLALAGAKDAAKLEDALKKVPELVRDRLA